MTEAQNLPAARPSTTIARPGAQIADEIVAHLRAELGTVRLGPKHSDPRADRLDLLAELCDRDTFQAVMAWLSSGKRRSRATRRGYADDIRFWATHTAELGHPALRLGTLIYEDITAWRLLQEARGVADRTVARRLSSLSSLHEHARRRGWDLTNPVDPEDHRPTIDRYDSSTATPVLELDQLQAIVAASDDAREALIVLLLYTLAGRVSEMCALNLEKRVMRGGRFCLDLTRKGRKVRILPLSPTVADLLDLHVADRTTGPLLLGRDGDRLNPSQVDRLLTRLGKRVGALPGRDVTPHVMRASRITHMIDAKEPLAEIQAFADHADPATTIGYFTRRQATERNGRLVDSTEELFTDVASRFRIGA